MPRASGFSARLGDRVEGNAAQQPSTPHPLAGGPPFPQAGQGLRPRHSSAPPSDCPASGLRSPVCDLADLVARFSLGWLAAANLAGLLLAALLLWPELNDALAPLTYGRWMPLHHNAQLYGWCALPLVGLLLRVFLVPGRAANRHTLVVLAAWSAALLLGAVSWLGGGASGKLFLDWTGAARIGFSLALTALWAVLAHHAFRRLAGENSFGFRVSSFGSAHAAPAAALRPQSSVFSLQPSPTLLRFALIAGLLLVPTMMYFSAGPNLFPPVNPNSGGATGVSLYGSTLGLLLVFAAMPWMVALPLQPGARRSRLTWPILIAALSVFATANHGHGSHHDRDQIITLGLLFLAPPLLARDWRRFVWRPEARGWLVAALVWGALLVADGWITFLPGFSERLKFTNALVAHSHLAMAGLITSVNMVFLLHLGDSSRVQSALGARTPFWLWQLAAALHIALLLALGWREGAAPALVLGGGDTTRLFYLVRLLAGAAMTVASLWWLTASFRNRTSDLLAGAAANRLGP
ncbi:MAG: hypothetical protein IPL39_24185 [Opitutaceae bacterium]|nr:hypothetical protein [Opitutaceae bacterium]